MEVMRAALPGGGGGGGVKLACVSLEETHSDSSRWSIMSVRTDVLYDSPRRHITTFHSCNHICKVVQFSPFSLVFSLKNHHRLSAEYSGVIPK